MNPCPYKEPICFLHAYLGLRFRAIARPKPPTIALSAKISFLHHGLQKLALIFPHRLILSASGRWLGAMSRFSTLCRNWANLLYFDYAARATVLLPVIMANPINERCSCSACLHTCSTCCQNQTPPFRRNALVAMTAAMTHETNCGCKGTTKNAYLQKKLGKIKFSLPKL